MITDDVLDKISQAAVLAPLHNPPGIQGIQAARTTFGLDTPQVAVFDTAYHQTMPAHAFMYGLPYDLYDKHHIRRSVTQLAPAASRPVCSILPAPRPCSALCARCSLACVLGASAACMCPLHGRQRML